MTNKTILEALETLESAYIRILSVTICALKSVSVTESDGMALEMVQGDSRVKAAKLEFSKAAAEQPTKSEAQSAPLVTVTITAEKDGSVKSDVQTHDNSFSEVHAGLEVVQTEIERVLEDREKCPFFPKDEESAQKKIIRARFQSAEKKESEKIREMTAGLRDLLSAQAAEQPEKEGDYLIVKETVVDLVGKRPQLGYTILMGETLRTLPEAHTEIKRRNLPIGWVCGHLSQFVPLSAHHPDSGEWQPIETAPKDKTILLGRFNKNGKWRTMRGRWFSREQIDEQWEEPEQAEEGWYETAVEPDLPNCWPIEPTDWQPLPPAPKDQQ